MSKQSRMTAVLLHGVGLDRTMWFPFREAFGRPTISYDLLGLGDAPKPAGPYSLTMYREQFERLVPAGHVDVIGFSMGALIAERIAIDLPQRVRRLVLVSGVFDRTQAERASIVERVAEVRGWWLPRHDPTGA